MKLPSQQKSRPVRRFNLSLFGLSFGFCAFALAPLAQAQYTWVGGSTPGSWSNATNWSASNSPVSATNTQLEFSFSGGGTESTNNLGSFTLNQLTHTSTGAAAKTITGNTLVFASNGATGPSIVQSSSTAGLAINSAISIDGVNLALSNTTGVVATLNSIISGTGSLDVRSGVWQLTGSSSSFSGGVNLSGASTQLVLNADSTGAAGAVTAGPAGTGKITLQGGVLRTANSATRTVNNDVDIAGNVQFGNSSPATSKLTLGGTVTLLGNTDRTVTLSGSNPVVLAGAVAGSGASSALTVVGTGTLELSGTAANTYAGNTTVNSTNATLLLNKTGANAVAGNLVVSSGTVLLGQGNQIADTATITNTGGLINLGGFTETVGSFRLTATTTAERLINGTLITSGGTGTNEVDNNAGIMTISANLQGSNQLFKNGVGILHLSGSNTYTGGTLIQQGSIATNGTAYGVVLKADEALGSGSLRLDPLVGGQARLALNGYDQTVSALSSGTNGLRVIEANGNEGGSVSTLTINQATDTVYSGILRDSNNTTSATLALVKTGSGLLDLSGVTSGHNYSGGLSVNGGTLGFGVATNALGTATITLGGGTLRYTASGGTNSTLANTIALGTATTSTLEVTDSSVGLTITNVVSGSGALSKTGSGTLTLSGANSYTGTTTVSGGTLVISKTNFTATITPTSIQLAYVTAPEVGTYDILPGQVGASSLASFSVSGSGNTTVTLTNSPRLQAIVTSSAPANQKPVINADQTFSVAENSAAGTGVGTLTATDADADPLSGWAIVSGNTGGAFALNSSTGQLTVLGGLNFEAASSYTLSVTVSDGTATSDPVNVTVSVSNVAEFSDIFGSEDPSADSNGDGISNLLAYALGATSSNSVVVRPSSTVSSSNLILTALVRTNDPKLEVRGNATTTLTNWPTNLFAGTPAADQTGAVSGVTQKQDFTVERGTNARQFLRLKATYSP